MAPLLNIFLALFTPWGRLSQLPFAVFALVILCVHGLTQVYLNAHIEDFPAYNAYSIGQIISLWMMFAILSRRFHDSGNAALILVPYFAMTFAAYLFALDNWKLAISPFEDDHDTAAWYERVRMVYQLLGIGIIIWALKDSGDEGLNAYGPEFGILKKSAHPRRTLESRAPVHAARAAVAHPPADDDTPQPRTETHKGPELRRGRITPVGPAGRAHGFGRR